VSLHRPYLRPIKTGKLAKDTEFGAKGALAHVDGFLGLKRSRKRGTGSKARLGTGKNIMDWIGSDMRERAERRCGCGRVSWR